MKEGGSGVEPASMSEDTLETCLEVRHGSIDSVVYELPGENVDPLTRGADPSQSSRVFKSG